MDATNIVDEATLEDKEWSEQYDIFIDEVSGDVKIGSFTYSASLVLKKIDPVAYRCGFSDWLDGIDEPWQCGECKDRYEYEEEAEECCKEE